MKYALLVYDDPGSWKNRSSEERHAIHREYHAVTESPEVIAHYRLLPPQMTTTLRVEERQTVMTEGPLTDTSEIFRALYLIESDDYDHVLEIAARIPAARSGGAIEVWPLAEPSPDTTGTQHARAGD